MENLDGDKGKFAGKGGWIEPSARRGRGARSNSTGRYEPKHYAREAQDWDQLEAAGEDEPPPRLRTHIQEEQARRIITRNQSPDIGFDRSINPYRGCEHGCIYCYARPTHAYMGLSPGLDFESRLFAKPNAAALLAKELTNPRYQVKPIALGTNTDPYQPIERTQKITRSILEVLSEFNHPATITTKSALVLRDVDILSSMAERNLVKVGISITTLDKGLARRMEPRAPTPPRRIATLQKLVEAGVPSVVMFAPVIPALNDHEMEKVLAAAHEAGVSGAGYVLLRLPLEIKDLFKEWLEEEAPERAGHILSLVRQMRGGKEYDSRWFIRGRGEGVMADLIAARFRAIIARLGLNQNRRPLDSARFRVPSNQGDLFV